MKKIMSLIIVGGIFFNSCAMNKDNHDYSHDSMDIQEGSSSSSSSSTVSSGARTEYRPFETLSDEVIVKILEYFDIQEFGRFAQTSRLHRDIVRPELAKYFKKKKSRVVDTTSPVYEFEFYYDYLYDQRDRWDYVDKKQESLDKNLIDVLQSGFARESEAIQDAELGAVKSLIAIGAHVNQGEGALSFAETVKMGQLLIDCGACVMKQNNEGGTVLHNVYLNKDLMNFFIETVKSYNNLALLKEFIAGVDNLGQTPLHHAAGAENTELLLETAKSFGDSLFFEQYINARDKHGNTPLHLAASNFSGQGSKMIPLLVKNGANLFIINKDLKRPFVVASNDEIEKILQKEEEKKALHNE